MDFIPLSSNPDDFAQLQADQLKYQQRQQLAQSLMNGGYVQNSGPMGVLTSALSSLAGGIMQRNNGEKVTDLLRRQFDMENKASQAKRAQELQDEQRKMMEEIYKGSEIARGKAKADKEFAKPEFTGGGVFDPATGQFAPSKEWMGQQLALERAKAGIAAANRAPAADPFSKYKLAVAQGILTPEQANQAIQRELMGAGGDKAPSGYRPKADGTLEFIPGGPADPSTTKTQPVSADNRNKLGLLDAAQAALGNYEKGGTDKGVPTPWANMLGRGPQNQQLDESIANVLRVESGAAIGKDEIAQARSRYAPGLLDKDETNTAKLQQLHSKIDAMRKALTEGTSEAAPAATPGANAQPTQTAVNPQTGQRIGLVNGQWVPL